MDVKLIGKNLIIKHELKKSDTYKISNSEKFSTVSIFKKPQIVKGIASYCEDGKHVLFIDYDNVPRWLVEQDYSILQQSFDILPAYLFCTKETNFKGDLIGNYHIICLQKFYPREVYKMLSITHADTNFMSMPLRRVYRDWVLRISTKRRRERPIYLGLLGSLKNLDKEVSKPHLDFLNKIYPLDKIDYQNLDANKKIFLQEYETS